MQEATNVGTDPAAIVRLLSTLKEYLDGGQTSAKQAGLEIFNRKTKNNIPTYLSGIPPYMRDMSKEDLLKLSSTPAMNAAMGTIGSGPGSFGKPMLSGWDGMGYAQGTIQRSQWKALLSPKGEYIGGTFDPKIHHG
jgi:hypothetical protein